MSDSTTHQVEWHVYLIRMRTNALYCGITTDVERRFFQHQQGCGAKALKGKGPLVLEWHCLVGSSRSIASKVEYKIKQLPKLIKEQLIKGEVQLNSIISTLEVD